MATDVTTLSKARQNLERLCDKVCDRREPVIIARKGGRHVVLMSLADYRYFTGEQEPSSEYLNSLHTDREREKDT
ncbi:type II toxin-antitoxin system Phd/YefM family antitoxin [Litchfieldella rifensis]|uniref:Antitoxin n=1 Tax=Litchfieldella rifensis TaxID=762643 RepID=A0ABV7LNL3_9GAMM